MSTAPSPNPAPAPTPKAVQNPLTLIMKIKSDAAYQELAGLLKQIQSRRQIAIPSGWPWINSKTCILPVLSFSITTLSSRLLLPTTVRSSYDGTFEAYINEFVDAIGDVFNALLQRMDSPPPLPVQQHRAEFLGLCKGE